MKAYIEERKKSKRNKSDKSRVEKTRNKPELGKIGEYKGKDFILEKS